MDANIPPVQQAMQWFMGAWISQIAGTLARLRVADRLADGPVAVGMLAEQLAVPADTFPT